MQVASGKQISLPASLCGFAVNSLICPHVEEGQRDHTWEIIFDLKCHQWISTRETGRGK